MRQPCMGLIVCIGVAAASIASAAEVKIVMSQGRTVCQTNERIYLGIVRRDPAALPAGNLVLTVSGEDASRLRAQDRVDRAVGKRCGGPQRVRGDACGDRSGHRAADALLSALALADGRVLGPVAK